METVERGDRERPHGRRFGALVHALLASIDLDAGVDAIKAGAITHGRLVDATEEEVEAAIATVGAALAHPILRRAAASAGKGELRRETPVLLRRDDGSLVEGTVDLAFYEDTSDFAGWTVVDFKTDREVEAISVYIAQVRGLYGSYKRSDGLGLARYHSSALITAKIRGPEAYRTLPPPLLAVQAIKPKSRAPRGPFFVQGRHPISASQFLSEQIVGNKCVARVAEKALAKCDGGKKTQTLQNRPRE